MPQESKKAYFKKEKGAKANLQKGAYRL